MNYHSPKTVQKLLKMNDLDNTMLTTLTLAAADWAKEKEPKTLPRDLPTTSHVLRMLIRRAYDELEAIKNGSLADSGMLEMITCHGGMRDDPPYGGYLRRS